MTFWELGFSLFGIRVIPMRKLGFYGRGKKITLENWNTTFACLCASDIGLNRIIFYIPDLTAMLHCTR